MTFSPFSRSRHQHLKRKFPLQSQPLVAVVFRHITSSHVRIVHRQLVTVAIEEPIGRHSHLAFIVVTDAPIGIHVSEAKRQFQWLRQLSMAKY